MDVKSLYTNIPNLEGIAVVKSAYGNYSKKSIANKIKATFLALIIVLVYQDIDNKLQTTLSKKPTDSQSYLHANSEHLTPVKRKYSLQPSTKCQKNLLHKF